MESSLNSSHGFKLLVNLVAGPKVGFCPTCSSLSPVRAFALELCSCWDEGERDEFTELTV